MWSFSSQWSARSASSRRSSMPQSVVAAAWQKPAPRAAPRRFARFAVAALASVLCAQYLAGFFLLWSVHADLKSASPLTITRYGYYYGKRHEVRLRLWAASFAGVAVVTVTLGVFLLPRRRSLHGDAR